MKFRHSNSSINDCFINHKLPPATTTSAIYKIVANGIIYNSSHIAQIDYFDEWKTLGTYYFNSSNNGSEYVELTDATGEAGSTYRKIGFDAVRWIKQ